MKKKVKILRTHYEEDKHLIIWQVRFLDDDQELNLVYRANDLAQAVLNNPDVKISAEDARFFNDQMEGQERFLEINQDVMEKPDLKNMTPEEIDNLSKQMNQYPYYELLGGKIDKFIKGEDEDE